MDVLRNPDTADPYFWAGFVLTGDGGVSTIQVPWLWWITVVWEAQNSSQISKNQYNQRQGQNSSQISENQYNQRHLRSIP